MFTAMTVTVARWLRRAADWLSPPVVVDTVTLTVPKDAIYQRAVAQCAIADVLHSPDHGEAKRHQVLARLGKDFPEASGKQLSLAIEAAVRG